MWRSIGEENEFKKLSLVINMIIKIYNWALIPLCINKPKINTIMFISGKTPIEAINSSLSLRVHEEVGQKNHSYGTRGFLTLSHKF
jgi:hypothetical protein